MLLQELEVHNIKPHLRKRRHSMWHKMPFSVPQNGPPIYVQDAPFDEEGACFKTPRSRVDEEGAVGPCTFLANQNLGMGA